MIQTRFHSALIVVLAATFAGCGPHRVRSQAVPTGQTQVVLLPDPTDGTVGAVVVTNPAGSAELVAARASTTVVANQPPASITVLNESDTNRLFGEVLSTLPPPVQRFTLNFRFESDELTPESRAMVPRVLEALKNRPFPDVAVIGHTDTTGSAASNYQLGLKRANAIRVLLIEAGVRPDLIEVSSHGEADLLIKTADQVPEPCNRRVEITVR
jgi:outer membrane protein OmpA-like peptidoglycan-associated protein